MTIDELKVYLESAIEILGGTTEETKAKVEAFSFVLSLINKKNPVLRLSAEEEGEILDRSENERRQAEILDILKRHTQQGFDQIAWKNIILLRVEEGAEDYETIKGWLDVVEE